MGTMTKDNGREFTTILLAVGMVGGRSALGGIEGSGELEGKRSSYDSLHHSCILYDSIYLYNIVISKINMIAVASFLPPSDEYQQASRVRMM